jgi:hypothetical protein
MTAFNHIAGLVFINVLSRKWFNQSQLEQCMENEDLSNFAQTARRRGTKLAQMLTSQAQQHNFRVARQPDRTPKESSPRP